MVSRSKIVLESWIKELPLELQSKLGVSFKGADRQQTTLFPELDDWVDESNSPKLWR
jgi:hypothetical protein